LGRAHLLAATAVREAGRAGLPIDSIRPVGSLRRCAPDVGDVLLLAMADPARHRQIRQGFARLPFVLEVLEDSPALLTLRAERGVLSLRVAAPDQAGAALVWHTGSRAHTARLQDLARRRGLTFADATLRGAGGRERPTWTEDVLYAELGLPYIPPELREAQGEIEAAERNALPTLVTTGHIRGDLHMHTMWSDGRNTTEDMVIAAHQLGYEYIAITDHSERSMASRRLLAADIPRQAEEIAALRERYPGIHLLHGVEVDIMLDGSLDFADAHLERFDIVLASLHDPGDHAAAGLTMRYLDAIRHPFVNVITHPANRSPAYSPGYDLDFDQVFAAAVEHGTALEIDGAPGHLDMDGALARRAAAAGVAITIDSDCHRADALGRQMRFGVSTARRGWIEPHHVLNTQPVSAIREFVQKKRAGR
jgi:DNA polymerase (family 10)